jgi:hypothetical protein
VHVQINHGIARITLRNRGLVVARDVVLQVLVKGASVGYVDVTPPYHQIEPERIVREFTDGQQELVFEFGDLNAADKIGIYLELRVEPLMSELNKLTTVLQSVPFRIPTPIGL